jgi:hypothetical protein
MKGDRRMCCCIAAFVAVFAPRLAFLIVWIFTPYVSRAFDSFVWPLLGLVFLPYTALLYSLAYLPGVGVVGWRWLWVILGVMLDISSYGSGGASKTRRSLSGR